VNDNIFLGHLITQINGDGNPSHIYTETHGNGASRGGYSFELSGHTIGANYLGTVWAPNGGILIQNGPLGGSKPTRIDGALWSATKVTLGFGSIVDFSPLSFNANFIEP